MKQTTLNLGGRLFSLAQPQVMGIVNVTPDSFYSGSRVSGENALRARFEEIVREGGTMIDLGGCSTRPGCTMPSSQEEMDRLRPALKLWRDEYSTIPLSVDTFRADVAAMAVEEYGANLINDIAGGSEDDKMFSTVARLGVPYILMHLEGRVAGMHHEATYLPDVETAVLDYFVRKVDTLRQLGAKDIILDPGFGFSKSPDDNYRLLTRCAEALVPLQLPILIGVSRKRMVWQLLESSAAEALNGTTVLHTIALLQGGADILRVHDVRAAVEAIRLVERMRPYLTL